MKLTKKGKKKSIFPYYNMPQTDAQAANSAACKHVELLFYTKHLLVHNPRVFALYILTYKILLVEMRDERHSNVQL